MTDRDAMLDLDPPARQVKALLNGITEADFSNPTPCGEMSVAALLDHFMGLTMAFTNAARKSTDAPGQAGPPQPSADHLDLEWRTKLPSQLDELVAAWKDPAAWQGEALAGGVTLPAQIMGIVAVDELVIHGWDLARATGQRFTCDTANLEAIIAMLSQSPDRGEGSPFGPIVEVSPDASLLDRAVGLSGRDPSWTP
jgi:uncharacterized protein (TIGR03086 family)